MRTGLPCSILLLLLLAFISSCSIQKRHYRDGFYISFHGTRVGEERAHSMTDTMEPTLRGRTGQEEVALTIAQQSDTVSTPFCSESRDVVKSKQKTVLHDALEKQKDPPAERTEQPGAEKDKPNRTVLLMILGALLLVALLLFVTVPVLGWWVYLIAIIGPAAGVLLYIAALLVRKRIVLKNMAGATEEKYRLSKWYPQFKLPLHLFFGSVVAGGIGLLMSYTLGFALNGFLSVLGMLIAGAAATSLAILAVVLLILVMLYLFKWRKSGDQKATPDEKKRKDG